MNTKNSRGFSHSWFKYFYCCGTLLLIVIGGCHGKMLYQQPEFAKQPSRIRTIAVLEPRLEVVRLLPFGKEKLLEEDDSNIIRIRKILSDSLVTILVQNGFSAKQLDESSMENLGLKNLSTSHTEISARVFDKKSGGAITLLDLRDSNPVRTATNSEDLSINAYLYTRHRRWCKSIELLFTEQLLLPFTIAAQASDPSAKSGCGSITEAVLVSASNMEILWANRISRGGLITELAVEGVLYKFPRILEAKK